MTCGRLLLQTTNCVHLIPCRHQLTSLQCCAKHLNVRAGLYETNRDMHGLLSRAGSRNVDKGWVTLQLCFFTHESLGGHWALNLEVLNPLTPEREIPNLWPANPTSPPPPLTPHHHPVPLSQQSTAALHSNFPTARQLFRSLMRKHIFVTGQPGVGKSTLIQRVLEQLQLPPHRATGAHTFSKHTGQ